MKFHRHNRPPRALRQRLLAFLLIPLLGMLVPSLFVDFNIAYQPAQEAFDTAIADDALAISRQIRAGVALEVDLPVAAMTVLRKDSASPEFFAVFGPAGELLVGDADLHPEAAAPLGEPVLTDGEMHGQKIRKASLRVDTPSGPAAIAVAEPLHRRERTASRIFTAMILPNLLGLVATLLVVYLGVRQGLAPLDHLGRDIARRAPHDLSPLPATDVPREAVPLIRAIDDLITDLRAASAAQQGFLANAAHQLKTPLSALQTQLDLAAAELPPEHRDRILNLRDASYRVAHLAHQLLALARSGPEANLAHEWRKVNLADLLDDGASRWYDAALAKEIDLGFEPAEARITGSEWLLREMLENLVDNAIRYTQRLGHVTVRCGLAEDGGPFVEVEDDGPGIPEAGREKIFERFFRPAGTLGEGSGLGLAVVKEVAERHAATVDLSTGPTGRGTRFRVRFPGGRDAPLSGR